MPEYEGRTITRRDRAHVAFNMKNAEDKDRNAREYVENLKKRWGTGVSALCLIYNATGDTITYAYTEIREEGHYDKYDNWNYISHLLYNSGVSKSDNWNGCLSTVITGRDTSPVFEAIFTLAEA
ncbi:unnamed protein product [Citrullus colocynthis]|uniref:Uncharacterized protein n=1 Tax=Citrullus colocynthis TaxID=252529 RepID=A0ABP0Z4Y2_9ROSI